jgi:hypothetical protein
MSFWSVVLLVLIGVPMVLMFTGMGAIFAAGGYANGGSKAHANGIVIGWLVFAWALAGAFGAFGLAPTWRAWHGGAENFDGGLRTYLDWLAGVGICAALALVVYRRVVMTTREQAERSPLLVDALRWLLFSFGAVPYAALAAWLLWPLASWPVQGHFAWPDSSTGWTHTAEITAVLVAAMVVETVVRKARKR